MKPVLLLLLLAGCGFESLTRTCTVPHLRAIEGEVYCSVVNESFEQARGLLTVGGRTTPDRFNVALGDLRVDYRPDQVGTKYGGYYTRDSQGGYVRMLRDTDALLHELLHHLDFVDGVASYDLDGDPAASPSGHPGWESNGYDAMISNFRSAPWSDR